MQFFYDAQWIRLRKLALGTLATGMLAGAAVSAANAYDDERAAPIAIPASSEPAAFAADATIEAADSTASATFKASAGSAPTGQASDVLETDSADSEPPRDGAMILLEAHEIAADATTDAHFTAVIDRCKQAAVTPLTEEAASYAHRLAAWAHNRRGELRDEEGDARGAFDDFDAAIRHDALRWQAVHNRGVSYAHAGRLKEAFDDFSRTIQLNPKHAKAYSNRAALYEQAGDFDAAMVDYRRAIEADPKLAVAHAGRGRVAHQTGDLNTAHAEYTEAIRLAPENATVYMARADLYAEMGKYEAALVNYGRAVELNPLLAEAYRNGAWLLATCPDANFRDEYNAVEGAQKAIELAGDERHLFLDTLAAAHANAGEFDAAVETASIAIDEAPEAFQAYYQERLRLYERGIPYRTQSLRQAP